MLSALDSTLLWGNLSVSLLVIVIGALLVPALSLRDALLAIVVGAVAGNALLGARRPDRRRRSRSRDGAAARAARTPGLVRADRAQRCAERRLVDLRADHHRGRRGRALPARLRLERRWLWTIAFGVLSWGLGMLGPIGFVRRYLRKFASWALLFAIGYLTYWAISKSHLHAYWARSGKGGFPSFGQAVDLVIGSVVSWTPLAADYTRFARTRRGAALGAGLGYFVPTIWCVGVGILIVLARGVGDAQALPAAVAAAGGVAFVALLAITIDESEKAFADIYSTAVSIQNLAATRVAAIADHARLRGRDRARARAQPRQLPGLPLPARLVLRPALRRARRRLARGGRALHPGAHLRRRLAPARAARCLARRLLPLPVALAGRPVVVDERRRAHPSRRRQLHRLAAELRRVVRPRVRVRDRRARRAAPVPVEAPE